MKRRLSNLVHSLSANRRSGPATDVPQNQLNLFAQHELYCVPPPAVKPIKLPRSVLVIGINEELTHYLSRVASSAMEAATKAYGSPRKAAVRLGTATHLGEDQEIVPTRKTLRLASSKP